MNKSLAYFAAPAIFSIGSSLAIAQGTVSPEAGSENFTTSSVSPITVETDLTDGIAVPADVTLYPEPAEIPEGAPRLDDYESFDLNTRALMSIIE